MIGRSARLVLTFVRSTKSLDDFGLKICWTIGVTTLSAEDLPKVIVLAVEAPGPIEELCPTEPDSPGIRKVVMTS